MHISEGVNRAGRQHRGHGPARGPVRAGGPAGAGGQGKVFSVEAFCCGALSILLSPVLLYAALALSGEGLSVFAEIFFWTHLGLMLIEGVIALLVLGFLRRLRPEVFAAQDLSSYESVGR